MLKFSQSSNKKSAGINSPIKRGFDLESPGSSLQKRNPKKLVHAHSSLVKNLFPTGNFDDKISSLRCSKPLAENLNPIEEENNFFREDIFARKPICGFDEDKVIVPKT